jgi:hypothetical protein
VDKKQGNRIGSSRYHASILGGISGTRHVTVAIGRAVMCVWGGGQKCSKSRT